jgi:hypothetical protein
MRVPDVDLARATIAALPAEVLVSEIDADDKVTLRPDWTAPGAYNNVNAAVGRWAATRGSMIFSPEDLARMGLPYEAFRQWAQASLVEITRKAGRRSDGRHRSVGDWRFPGDIAPWRAVLRADFVLVLQSHDFRQTPGRHALTMVRPPGGFSYALRNDTACLVSLVDGRIVSCSLARTALPGLESPDGAWEAVDFVTGGLFPPRDGLSR